MPLESGHSKAAFSHNVAVEAKTRPQKQAVAIAYAVARKDVFENPSSPVTGYMNAVSRGDAVAIADSAKAFERK